MTAIQAIILGIVEGLTEFLPISSSAHLTFISSVLHWQLPSQDFDILIHVATLVAVVIYFRNDLIAIIKGILGKNPEEKDKQTKLLINLFVAVIILVPFVLLLKPLIDASESMVLLSLILFIIFGIPLIFIEKIYQQNNKTIGELTWKNSLGIGFSQCLALFSGVSRSGITIMSGLFTGLTKEEARRFTFLLAIPTIFAGFLLELVKQIHNFHLAEGSLNIALGMIAALISGLLAIKIMLDYLKTKSLAVFGYYRIILGIILLVLMLFKII